MYCDGSEPPPQPQLKIGCSSPFAPSSFGCAIQPMFGPTFISIVTSYGPIAPTSSVGSRPPGAVMPASVAGVLPASSGGGATAPPVAKPPVGGAFEPPLPIGAAPMPPVTAIIIIESPLPDD